MALGISALLELGNHFIDLSNGTLRTIFNVNCQIMGGHLLKIDQGHA